MTDADEYSDLYAKAKAATEGPRSVQECCDSIEIHVGEGPHEYELCYIDTYGAEPAGMEYARDDAAFIAAAHPAAVRALIDEVRELKRIQVHQVREYAKEVLTNQKLTAENERMRKQIDEIQADLNIKNNTISIAFRRARESEEDDYDHRI